MSQIRNMLRALAFDRCGPRGLVVSRLDRALTMFEDPPTATLAPARQGIPVGIDASVPRFNHTHPLPPGATLLLFTDGLVERRDQHIDTGLECLAEQAASLAAAPLDEQCDAVITRSGQVFDDDVAVLALRIPGGPAR
ncbi:SpoIIE family protein phosphatase [Streptomyces sp. NPDC001852]|uniref:SpoIIE family protein phosphatase n=1 Tax=Streptomyces sp. NPDC001852 TaxID=3364619 RepID=UPI0036A1D6A6